VTRDAAAPSATQDVAKGVGPRQTVTVNVPV
jgi:hypothetical protein